MQAEQNKQYVRFAWPLGYTKIKREPNVSSLTDERITYDQSDKFLGEVERIYFEVMRPVYIYTVIALTYTLISLSFNLFNQDNEVYTDMAWLIDGAWYLSYLFAFTMGYFFYEHKKEKVVANLQALIQIHHSIFGSKELRWVIPGDFPEGIELWKDYVMTNTHAYIEMPCQEQESAKLIGRPMF